MKKLALAIVTVAVAAVSQAATVNWGVTGVYGKDGNLLSGGVAYVFNNKNSGYANPAALQAALAAAADIDAINAILTNADPALGGAVTDGAVNNSVDFSATSIPGKTSGVNTFAVIFDTATVTADSNYFVTSASGNVKTVDPSGTASSTFTIANQTTASQAAGAWTAAAAPEPTSGLLLLLGVAGLALKRKRA